MRKETLKLSSLNHTWIIDLDGTLVEHNGYKTGEDKLLDGVKEFMQSIPAGDYVLILTGREIETKQRTEEFLKENGIRYDKIIFEMPLGERILINDSKPSGLICSYSLSPERNEGLANIKIETDENL